ncbi:MAG: ribosomal protein S18-alanine N-acetyltransferase [Candidatus Cloacimonetes bacterium]|nr:ribosomal protein S18-alanine N-acetyltransferase [Candidatus Cloacimonadota bacterium]
MKETVIRLMKSDDLSEVLIIEEEVFTDPWLKDMFIQEIEQDSAFVLETKDDKELIGYICGLKVLDEYMITNIAITKSEQHKGYGKLLLRYLFRELIKEGCKKCFLEVRASNKQAITFYTSHGFDTIGKRKEYYQNPIEDALIMKLDFAEPIQRWSDTKI